MNRTEVVTGRRGVRSCLVLLSLVVGFASGTAGAQESYPRQERLPWEQPSNSVPSYGADRGYGAGDGGRPPQDANEPDRGAYRPPQQGESYSRNDAPRYGGPESGQQSGSEYGTPYQPPPGSGPPSSYSDNRPYTPHDREPPPRRYDRDGGPPPRYDDRRGVPYDQRQQDRTYSQHEIVGAGHKFFGSVSRGLASVIEYAFKQAGRPNGYILGEDAGGAFVAGLRYGEGTLYTKDAGSYRVYWQGPSIGYDFGAEGSKVMVLLYNLQSPEDIFDRFGGVQGSAYVVGGAGIQFLKRDNLTIAPIRAGIGLRLGANVGYLKFTRRPTWNPF